jgi:DNA-binding transcriptional LysR family regulator
MDPSSLDLKKLRAFQLAALHGNLREAARRLGLTIPAISFQVKRLEDELGVALFKRLPNSLVLTAAGEYLLKESDGIYQRIESALGGLTSTVAPKTKLTVSTSSDLVWYFSPRISAYIRRHPGVAISLHIYRTSETLDLVARGSIDLGIGFVPKLPRTLARERVTDSTLSLACSVGHPLLRRQPARLADIARHRLLLLPHGSSTRTVIDDGFAAAGIETGEVIEAGNCRTALEFAERGVGVAIIHSLCVGHMDNARLSYIDLGHQFGRVEFSVIYRRRSKRPPPLQGLLDALTSPHAPGL